MNTEVGTPDFDFFVNIFEPPSSEGGERYKRKGLA